MSVYKPIDFTVLHIRAKTWAERIAQEYYKAKVEHIPEQIPPQIGVENGTNTVGDQSTSDLRKRAG